MQDDQKHFWLLVIPVKIWLYKYLKARSPELFEGLANKLIPWRGKMDEKQNIGTIGSVEEKLEGGKASVDVHLEVDLVAELQKKIDAMADGWQKVALGLAIQALKSLS